jgi:hypothetical protein
METLLFPDQRKLVKEIVSILKGPRVLVTRLRKGIGGKESDESTSCKFTCI